MSTDAYTPSPLIETPLPTTRTGDTTLFTLVELDPQQVVEGVKVANGFEAEDVTAVGKMRETCPHCTGTPLQLVLRTMNVIRPYLFCEQCTRCFDANYPDGRSALQFPGVPVVY